MSLAQLGSLSLYLALGFTLYGMLVGFLGAARLDARLVASARFAALAVFFALTTAVIVLEAALLSNDFSVKYVAETSSLASPVWVKVVTLWAALEGSLVLWAWVLAAYGAALAFLAANTYLRPWGVAVMQTVGLFFVSVVALVANPFELVSNPPLDGPGPNPLLQNHWMMVVHPVLMYLGVVGLTVPFAYALAALITRRPGSDWMRETRVWTLLGWGFLSAAIVAGGWWSYEVLGWGGYWAWDPVENVILLPWLTATAFVHSVQVQERRRMLKTWNVFLIVLTFALSILGTFLIRSGVLSSVHSFGAGPVGPIFLGFFILVLVVAFGLVALRWDQLRDVTELDSPISREGGFLVNNVLFLAIAFAVLLGTLFPLIVEAVTGNKVTVGAPFFNQLSLPAWLAILLLMGVGPLLPWRRAAKQSLRRNLLYLALGALVGGLAAYLFGVRKVYPLLTVAASSYNLVSLCLLLGGAVQARASATGRRRLAVLRSYALDSRRRFGSMIVHFGVVVIALGVTFSSGYRSDTQLRLTLGEPLRFQGYELTFVRPYSEALPQRASEGIEVTVAQNGRVLKTLRPRINQFRNAQQTVTTPGVLYRPFEDVYLNLARLSDDGQTAVVRAVRSPLITWIWIGAAILLLGTGYALTPVRASHPRLQAEGAAA